MNDWITNRRSSRLVTLAVLGLAFSIFVWGLQYKLSLYDPPQAASHQIPKAKILSKDEQSRGTENPLVVRTKTSSSVLYTAPTSIFFILLPTLCIFSPTTYVPVVQRANRSRLLSRAILSTVFVRPPPALV